MSGQQQESENGSNVEDDSNDSPENSDWESDLVEKKSVHPCYHCEGSNVYNTGVRECPNYFWQDNRFICPICGYKIPYEGKYMKDTFGR